MQVMHDVTKNNERNRLFDSYLMALSRLIMSIKQMKFFKLLTISRVKMAMFKTDFHLAHWRGYYTISDLKVPSSCPAGRNSLNKKTSPFFVYKCLFFFIKLSFKKRPPTLNSKCRPFQKFLSTVHH